MEPSPEFTKAAIAVVGWISFVLEALGALAIAVGAAAATIEAVRTIHRRHHTSFVGARLELGRFLALALEFQLAADILETSISPDWTKIGHLAAIGAIRTALNYFLARDMHEEQPELTATRE